jgi:hypothetical protein
MDNRELKQEGPSGSDNVRERVQTLAEKASDLSETLERVKKSLEEASGEAK